MGLWLQTFRDSKIRSGTLSLVVEAKQTPFKDTWDGFHQLDSNEMPKCS